LLARSKFSALGLGFSAPATIPKRRRWSRQEVLLITGGKSLFPGPFFDWEWSRTRRGGGPRSTVLREKKGGPVRCGGLLAAGANGYQEKKKKKRHLTQMAQRRWRTQQMAEKKAGSLLVSWARNISPGRAFITGDYKGRVILRFNEGGLFPWVACAGPGGSCIFAGGARARVGAPALVLRITPEKKVEGRGKEDKRGLP